MKRIKTNLIFKILQCSLENFGESLKGREKGNGEFCLLEIENTTFFSPKLLLALMGQSGVGEAFV